MLKEINKTHLFWLILTFALLLRLISLITYPLMDTTEARYGEMGRLMVETGNWLTPQFDYGIPYWGKPPLFIWISALSIELFGVNEFAIRIPHWLAGVITIALLAFMTHRAGFNPLVTAIVLATCGIFSLGAGIIMADMVLTMAISIAMIGFYHCWLHKDRYYYWWGYLGFFGLACGLLTKGPVVVVMMGIAIFPWLIIQHGFIGAFKALWQRFPIVSGVLLMLAISLPWFIMAEAATPGFIDYFIVGEHFKRFVISGWEGDLYGRAHIEPYGKIWIFWLYSAAPWSLVLLFLIWKRRKTLRTLNTNHASLLSFALCWLISPMILFTMAGNILPAYVMPSVPALGLIIAMLISNTDFKWFVPTAMIAPTALIIAMLVLIIGPKAESRSDYAIFEHITNDLPVFYVSLRPFSGQFYSNGQAKQLENIEMLDNLKKFYLIGKPNEVEALYNKNKWNCSNEFAAESKRTLYFCIL